MRKIVSTFLLFTICLIAQEITVATAANVQYAIKEIKEAFKKSTGITVKTVIASSGKLTAQIKSGAPFDLFLSADMKYPRYLKKLRFAIDNPKVYAYGTLVLWSLKPIDLNRGIKSLLNTKIKKIAIPNPKNAPYGSQAVIAMKNAGIYKKIKSKLIYAESVSQTNQYIASKVVDAGLTAKSVVFLPQMSKKGKFVEIDPSLYLPIKQGVVMLKHSQKKPKATKAFYDFLFSLQGKSIFKKFGYIVK